MYKKDRANAFSFTASAMGWLYARAFTDVYRDEELMHILFRRFLEFTVVLLSTLQGIQPVSLRQIQRSAPLAEGETYASPLLYPTTLLLD
jgi:hypothetical protein